MKLIYYPISLISRRSNCYLISEAGQIAIILFVEAATTKNPKSTYMNNSFSGSTYIAEDNTSSWLLYGYTSDSLIAPPTQTFNDYEPMDQEYQNNITYELERSHKITSIESPENSLVPLTSNFMKVLFCEPINRPKWINTQQFVLTPQGYSETSLAKFQTKSDSQSYTPSNQFSLGSRLTASPNTIPILDMNQTEKNTTILYKDCLRPYFTFMLCQRTKQQLSHGRDSLFCKLPPELHKIIFGFVGESVSFFLRDEAGHEGTYLTVPSKYPKALNCEKMYKLSNDTSLRIVELNDGSNTKELTLDPKIRENQSYILRKFAKYDNVKILGLNSCNTHKLYANLTPFNKDKFNVTRNLKWEDKLKFTAPFAKIELIEEKGKKVTRFFLICSQKNAFLVGRNETADIPVTNRNCSRKHCTIFFDPQTKGWKIVDGNGDEASLGGTWESLRSINQINNRERSEEVPIVEGSRFKFGEAIYDFTYKKVKK